MAWPDRALLANHFDVSIPKLGRWLMTGGAEARAARLKAFAHTDQPPSFLVFYPFRASVGLGLLMIGLGLWGLCWGPRGRPARSRLYLLAATDMRPPGFMAVICGRIVAEVGRQPHVVFGVLRAADAVASHREGQDWASLCGLLAIYAVMFSAGALDIPCFIARGPDVGEAVAAGPRRAQISFGRRAAAAPLISTCR